MKSRPIIFRRKGTSCVWQKNQALIIKSIVSKSSLKNRVANWFIPQWYQSAMLAMLLWVPRTGAETWIIPNGAETSENPRNVAPPFASSIDSVSQQIYSPSLFPVIPSPGQLFQLEAISFRLSSQGPDPGASSAFFDRVEVRISTGVGPFTTTLEQNHGQNLLVVHDQSIRLRGGIPAGTTPSSFDLNIPFSTPFFYDPSQGALVVEIRKYGSGELSVLAGAEIPGSTFYFNRGFGVETLGNIGLESSFSYQIVPEPSEVVLFILGMLMLFSVARRKR